MMADSEGKFNAAVQVVSSLPKSGSFQPSHEMMLNFYGNYKQAKEGPCKKSKPYLWDVVNKAKWEAWSKLGNISKEDAMENYVNALKEVIETMPETGESSQVIEMLKPFYQAVYQNSERLPPIFNSFLSKHKSEQTHEMNGHLRINGTITSYSNMDENGHAFLNMSNATLLHNIDNPENDNHDLVEVELQNNEDEKNNEKLEKVTFDVKEKKIDVKDYATSNGQRGDNDNEDDDDDLFCDSLGPELLEQQGQEPNNEDVVVVEGGLSNGCAENKANYSSLSDVEIIEQFSVKDDTESCGVNKTTHVHFDDSSSSGEQNINKTLSNLSMNEKSCMVQPNQLGAGSGGGDHKEMFKATSEKKHAQRNVSHHSDRPSRYGQRYRGRSHESDSDESPGRSDHNSSSERDDDMVIDKIADLLIEIQDDMKNILQRLKSLENSLQQNNNWWFENYTPSKTLLFLIIWPFVVNILFRFLQKRYHSYKR